MGASAGGIEALSRIINELPPDFSIPIVIVLHLPEDSKVSVSELFAAHTDLQVKEAEEKEAIFPGFIYFAPPGYHLLLEEDGTFSFSLDEPVNFSRPSIDVLFESASIAYGSHLLGILLTGASGDGAIGLLEVKKRGGVSVVQDPKSAESKIMPQAAIKLNPPDFVLSLPEMSRFIARLKWKN